MGRHGRRGRRAACWIARAAIATLGVIALIVTVAMIVLHTGWGREQIRRRIEAVADEAIRGDVQLGHLDGSVLGDLVISDVVVTDPSGRPVISASRVDIEFDLWSLMSNHVSIDRLIIDDLTVASRIDADGKLDLAELAVENEEETPFLQRWTVDIDHLMLRRGGLSITTVDGVTAVEGLAIDASLHAAGDTIRTAVALQATARDPRLPAPAQVEVDARIDADGDGLRIDGGISAHTDRFAVQAAVAPGAHGAIHALSLDLHAGDGHAAALAAVDLGHRRYTGTIAVDDLDLSELAKGLVPSRLDAGLTFDLTQPEAAASAPPSSNLPVQGTITVTSAHGLVDDVPLSFASARITFDGPRLVVDAAVVGRGDTTSTITAALERRGEDLQLLDSRVQGTIGDLGRLAGRRDLAGNVTLGLSASGALTPKLDLAVDGTIDGRRLRAGEVAVAHSHATIALRHLPSAPTGQASAVARDVIIAGDPIHQVTTTVRPRRDGGVDITTLSAAGASPRCAMSGGSTVCDPAGGARWAIDLAASLWPRDGGYLITLGHHRGVADGVPWSGRGGTIAVLPERIAVADVGADVADGRITMAGTYWRAGGRAEGDVHIDHLDLSRLASSPRLAGARGQISARIRGTLRGNHIDASAIADARGVSVDGSPPIDGGLNLSLEPGRLHGDLHGSGGRLGAIAVTLDLAAPHQVTDARAWQSLRRDALRAIHVQLDRVDAAAWGELFDVPGVTGVADGTIDVGGGHVRAALHLRNASATPRIDPAQPFDLDLTVDPSTDARDPGGHTLGVDLRGPFSARGVLGVELPDRLLSPPAWQRMGRTAVRGGVVRIERVDLASSLVVRNGLEHLAGLASVRLDLAPALASGTAIVTVIGLRGGPVIEPVDINAEAAVDADRITGQLQIGSGGTRLVVGGLTLGAGLAALERRGFDALAQATVRADLSVPEVSAPHLAGIFGRSDVTRGVVDASIEIRGTPAAPTANVAAVITRAEAAGIQLPIVRLTARADRDQVAGDLRVEQNQGHLRAHGRIELGGGALSATVVARSFDLRPIAGVAPEQLAGLAGTADVDLRLEGTDPAHGRIRGTLRVRNGFVPVGGALGMLRGASLDIVIADQRATITGAARVGTGRIRVEGQGRFQGVMPTLISATATLRGVPFTLDELEPRVDAKVALSLWRSVGLWRSRVTVSDVDVVLIERNNPEILPVTFPDDLVFVDEIPARGTAPERRRSDAPAPGRDRDSAPAMIAKVRIVPAMVRSRDLRTRIGGELEVRLGGGDPVVHGKLEADEGFVELFGRRYLIMSATVRFDGGPDPYIAVRLAYDFPEATLYIDLTGRASAPKIVLSSEPAIYSQSQLAAFLLGSTPEDAPGDATRDAAASVAAAVVSDTVRNAIDDVLPIPIDVLRVETKTTERSGSVTVGKWITRRVLVALRTRVDAHADENANEAELEYWIRRNVLLEAYAGDRSIFGADLLWIRRY